MTARANQTRIPSYTEVHTTSPTAAGLPVLEVVRRLEEEKLINKDDRVALKDGLYSVDVARREAIVNALCEVELSMNSRFSLRRLKAVIHQNGGGEVSSKSQHPAPASNGYVNFPTNTSNNTGNTNNTTLKSDPRPSKYRIKPKNSMTPEITHTPLRSNSDHTNNTNGISSGSVMSGGKGSPQYQPSSSGSVGSGLNTIGNAGLRLFSSPIASNNTSSNNNINTTMASNGSNGNLQVHSAREKSSGPVFTGFSSDSGQAINYTNNNIPMSSPITSRSRGEDGSSGGIGTSISRVSLVSTNTGASAGSIGGNVNSVVGSASVYSSGTNGISSGSNGIPSGRHRTSPTRQTDTNSNNYYSNNNNGSVTNNPDSDDYMENISTINAINQVVGNQPVYSGALHFLL